MCYCVVVLKTGTEDPIRLDLDAGEKFVMVAMTLWKVGHGQVGS